MFGSMEIIYSPENTDYPINPGMKSKEEEVR
jgi:hypothetical protein